MTFKIKNSIINQPNCYLVYERDALSKCAIKNIGHRNFPKHTIRRLGLVSITFYDLYYDDEKIGEIYIQNYIKSRTIIYNWFVKGNLGHSVELFFVEKIK